ncbi:MAG: hypothetical protein JXQ73_16135 [Phycisphaerae bacterium]|nr:hypothetical protein [Phycisphaerae bacterium]
MGKPVICPHCNKFFVSDNEPGNPFCMCPQCGRWMNIAPPVQPKKTKPAGPIKCPFCGAQMAPGNDTCLKCQRQIITGQKLPVVRRFVLMPTWTKMAILCGALAGIVLVIFLVNVAINLIGRPSRGEPNQVIVTESAEVVTARGILSRLLASKDEAEQVRLGDDLGNVGPGAVGLIMKAFDNSSLVEGQRRALIAALGEIGDSKAADLVAREMRDPRFNDTALMSLSLMGDSRAVGPMMDRFTARVKLVSLGKALARRSLLPQEAQAATLERVWNEDLTTLHRPVAALGSQALPRLLETYWSAWGWPMRDRGRAWLDQANDVVSQMTLGNGSVDAALESLLTGQPAEVRLGAALLLSKRSRGDRRGAEQWSGKIADLLADGRLEVRQRAVWTIVTITGRTFGRFGADRSPQEAPELALKEIAAWIRERTGKEIRIDPGLLAQHGPSRSITRRTYHPARVEAAKLAEGLSGADWAGARERWRKLSELPPDAAPVVRTLLDGDVRQIKLPARLIVLELLAQWRDGTGARKMDRLTEPLDSPAWMKACVAVAKASASREDQTVQWLDRVAGLGSSALEGKDPDRGLVAADLGRLIAPQGKPALLAMHRDSRFRSASGALGGVYNSTIDAMIDFGWPANVWLQELGGR